MASTTDKAASPYSASLVFKEYYDMLVARQHLPEAERDIYDAARHLWTFIMQRGYFNLLNGHDWSIFPTRPYFTPHNDPVVVAWRRIKKGGGKFELCGVLAADDYVQGSWEKQEKRVVGFVKGVANREEFEAHEDGVFVIAPQGTRVRFYWLDGEGMLKPYAFTGERAFDVKKDEKEILEVLKDIHERFARSDEGGNLSR